jgi:hypothetical protein
MITYIGLDGYKQSISIGLGYSVADQKVCFFSDIANGSTILRTLAEKFLADRGGRRRLCFCYDAVQCGY